MYLYSVFLFIFRILAKQNLSIEIKKAAIYILINERGLL
jgi:hypothetical protein